jgi:hypothetical protein
MFPLDLLDEAGGLVHQQGAAWRCFACGEIIDTVISENRRRMVHSEYKQPERPEPRLRRLVDQVANSHLFSIEDS